MRSKKAFTLIELLIVISIISFLAIVIVAFLRTQIFKANDARRKADLKRIGIAVEEYEKDKDCYPATVTCTANTSLLPYLDIIPCDPITNDPYYYEHEGTSCPKWYTIYSDLENTSDVDYLAGIGQGSAYSYYQSSPNAPEVIPTQPSPTSSPSPAPTGGGDVFYGCFSGLCQPISGTICQPNYGSSSCYSSCGTPQNPQNECIIQ